jgi:hypothetical protein
MNADPRSPPRSAAILHLAGLCAMNLLLAACHQPAAAGADAPAADTIAPKTSQGVSLKPDEIERMGIVVTAAASAQHIAETSGFGVITPHELIAQGVADWVTAAAVERQSQAASARARRLADTAGAMPADAREAAERQTAVDQAALQLAKRRLTAAFGQNPPWQDHADSPVLRALADGESKLVRVTFPLGSLGNEAPRTLRMAHLSAANAGASWVSAVIWPAPADATVPGRSFFALLEGSDAGEGERLLVWSPSGAAQSGALIPASAAVMSDGKYWCYVERKPGWFVRAEIDTGMPVAQAYFVRDGIAAGDKVVTRGAGLMLAHETNPDAAAD